MYTIVVIEDQPVLASAYRNKFQGEGFNVEVALDGQQGLDLISRIKPDLVLLDMHLPNLSGLEILKKVRSDPEFQALPIIVFSNLTKPGAVEEAWNAGATLVLSKLNTSPKRVLESVQGTPVGCGCPSARGEPPTIGATPPVCAASDHRSIREGECPADRRAFGHEYAASLPAAPSWTPGHQCEESPGRPTTNG